LKASAISGVRDTISIEVVVGRGSLCTP